MTAINYSDKKNTANADKFENSLLSRGSAGDFIVSVGGHAIPQNNTLKCCELPLMISWILKVIFATYA